MNLVFQDWPAQLCIHSFNYICAKPGVRGTIVSIREMEGRSQGSWSLLGETDMWTDTLQHNVNRKLIKVRTKCCRSPEKGTINFDCEGKWHSCGSYRKRVCQMESRRVIFYCRGCRGWERLSMKKTMDAEDECLRRIRPERRFETQLSWSSHVTLVWIGFNPERQGIQAVGE